ncbi:MAG: hypothetical protein JXD22_17370 [Sedimentisphaerales bacterium]|nr:hypothetical protein [Sedimentisphaerales bacterium]
MDFPEPNNNNHSESDSPPKPPFPSVPNDSPVPPVPPVQSAPPASTKQNFYNVQIDIKALKSFFNMAGGSIFYCISSVLVTYGIVKLMGPILSGGQSLKGALPCILTLHGYELALLAVLLIIVSRKVVDDAVSLVILIALFLIGTSIALGSIADMDPTGSFYLALAGSALALGKLISLKLLARIPFRALSLLAAFLLVTCNYLGPVILAKSLSIDPSQELTRRNLWLKIWLILFVAVAFILIESYRNKKLPYLKQLSRPIFLQSPVMAYIFTLILLLTSCLHQYSTSFTYAIERVLGDYPPAVFLAALLLIEILRHLGKRFGFAEIAIISSPLAVLLLAIHHKSVIASSQFGLGLLWYPPVLAALIGLAVFLLGIYRRRQPFLAVAYFYGLAVILTLGFSPTNPHNLNILACLGTLVASLLIYGIIKRNQFICFSGLAFLCLGLNFSDKFISFAKQLQLSPLGTLAGILGIGLAIFYLIFGKQFHKTLLLVMLLSLAAFIYDILPIHFHLKYLIALAAIIIFITAAWLRTGNFITSLILFIPLAIKSYLAAKILAHWRIVILGFLLLAAGAIISLMKKPKNNEPPQYP